MAESVASRLKPGSSGGALEHFEWQQSSGNSGNVTLQPGWGFRGSGNCLLAGADVESRWLWARNCRSDFWPLCETRLGLTDEVVVPSCAELLLSPTAWPPVHVCPCLGWLGSGDDHDLGHSDGAWDEEGGRCLFLYPTHRDAKGRFPEYGTANDSGADPMCQSAAQRLGLTAWAVSINDNFTIAFAEQVLSWGSIAKVAARPIAGAAEGNRSGDFEWRSLDGEDGRPLPEDWHQRPGTGPCLMAGKGGPGHYFWATRCTVNFWPLCEIAL